MSAPSTIIRRARATTGFYRGTHRSIFYRTIKERPSGFSILAPYRHPFSPGSPTRHQRPRPTPPHPPSNHLLLQNKRVRTRRFELTTSPLSSGFADTPFHKFRQSAERCRVCNHSHQCAARDRVFNGGQDRTCKVFNSGQEEAVQAQPKHSSGPNFRQWVRQDNSKEHADDPECSRTMQEIVLEAVQALPPRLDWTWINCGQECIKEESLVVSRHHTIPDFPPILSSLTSLPFLPFFAFYPSFTTSPFPLGFFNLSGPPGLVPSACCIVLSVLLR
jgi:hypothetical protein